MTDITVYNLIYTKADLDAAPADERLFFLMASSVANDTQMLNKLLALTLERFDATHRFINQGNSAQGFMILRMLTGRLNEAWKMLASSNRMIKVNYLADLSDDAQASFRSILAYFGSKRSLILDVRNGVAFHHLREHVEAAYQSLDPATDLGDYLNQSIGNTLYYTTEILQYETLKNLAGLDSQEVAITLLIQDIREQTTNFNTFLFSFALVFAQRYLPKALEQLKNHHENFEAPNFEDLRLPFFFHLPNTR